jgi:hypothetical protein
MKNFITGMVLLLSTLSLFSCTKTIYTHEQVLGRYQTKQDVMKTFGIPTEKKTNDTTEEWLYRYERNDSFRKHSVEEFHNIQTANVADFNRYKKYLIFTFDQKGNVIRADFEGVDLAVKKADALGTIVLVVAGAGIVLGAAAIAISNTSFSIGY